jgi:hypothetical protein
MAAFPSAVCLRSLLTRSLHYLNRQTLYSFPARGGQLKYRVYYGADGGHIAQYQSDLQPGSWSSAAYLLVSPPIIQKDIPRVGLTAARAFALSEMTSNDGYGGAVYKEFCLVCRC